MNAPTDHATFLHAVQHGDDDPASAFRALHAFADALIGARLFTLMRFDAATGEACRLYTSDPANYPVSGTKPLPDNHWTAQVIERREVFVANDLAGLGAVFPDHALIDSLGCQAVINVPVAFAGEVIGTVNCLHGAGRYTDARVRSAAALVMPGLVALLAARRGQDRSIP